MAGGAMVAMHAIMTGGIDPIEYFQRNHLGSIALVTDASGKVPGLQSPTGTPDMGVYG